MNSTAQMVSIIMPAYNCEKFIATAIESVLAQRYPHWELLLADDASLDATRAISDAYAAKDARIRVFHNEKNEGIVRTRNHLLNKAEGSFITMLDADDWIAPDKLSVQVNYLNQHNVPAVGVNYFLVSINGTIVQNTKGRFKEVLYKEDIYDLPFWPPSILITHALLKKVGAYHSYFNDMACYEDLYWLYDILEETPVYFIDKPLYYYRHNPASVTKTINFNRLAGQKLVNALIAQRLKSGKDWLTTNAYAKADDYIKLYLANASWKSELYRIYAAIRIDEGDFKNGRYLLKKAFQLNPFKVPLYRTFLYLLRQSIQVKAPRRTLKK